MPRLLLDDHRIWISTILSCFVKRPAGVHLQGPGVLGDLRFAHLCAPAHHRKDKSGKSQSGPMGGQVFSWELMIVVVPGPGFEDSRKWDMTL